MVSIIITTYNRAELLKKCLVSIFRQTYNDYEVIIIDDASKDDVYSLINSFSNKIKYMRLEHNSNANFSRLKNIGLKHSEGDYIAFCDDDDLWYPNKLELQMKYFPTFDAVCCNASIINHENKVTKKRYFNNYLKNTVLTTDKLIYRNNILISGLVMKRKIINDGYYFDEEIGNCNEDYEYYLRVSQKYKILYMSQPLISIRMHENFTNYNHEVMVDKAINLIKPYLVSINDDLRLAAQRGITACNIHLFKYYIKSNKYKKAILSLMIIFRYISKPRIFIFFIYHFLISLRLKLSGK